MAKLVILGPLLGVPEDGVGFVDCFKPLLRPGFLVHIWMEFPSQAAVGLLNLLLRCAPGNAQHIIVILLSQALHRLLSADLRFFSVIGVHYIFILTLGCSALGRLWPALGLSLLVELLGDAMHYFVQLLHLGLNVF